MNVQTKPIIVVQGAQWGSEAKGMVAAALCERRKVDYAVRTGTVNAGHTVYHKGKRYVMQQLPTGWVNENTRLVIGPGAYIHPEILLAEITMLAADGAFAKGPRLYIDERAGLHLPEHTEAAQMTGAHYKIGATGKGCSHAIISRIRNRGYGGQLFREWFAENSPTGSEIEWMSGGFFFTDTAKLLNEAYDRGNQILLEGTQGTMLDLYLGPYPYTTHKQCTASQWVTEAGLSPALDYEVVLVARTYPIRVAGNSGPMNYEITWPELTGEINAKLIAKDKPALVNPAAVTRFLQEHRQLERAYGSILVQASEQNRDALANCPDDVVTELRKLWEFTTVTKKLRRVARLDLNLLKYSVMLNRPQSLVLTFLNYEFPHVWGAKGIGASEWQEEQKYIRSIEEAVGAPINAVTTGPESCHYLSR